MPIYEYRCNECGKIFEEFQKITDEPLTKCPDCSGLVVRLISESSFALKGGGWYKDGYSGRKATETKVEKKKSADKVKKK